MTNEEKLKILLDREERAYELLRKLEPTSEEFATCLRNANRCYYVRTDLEYAGMVRVERGPISDKDEELKGITDFGVGDAPGNPGHSEPDNEGSTDACDPAPAQEPETEQPKPEAKEEAAAPATNDAPQLTQVEVRDRLSAVSIKHGSDVVTGAMAELGFVKLSQIPAERYGELLDKVEEAVRCRQ